MTCCFGFEASFNPKTSLSNEIRRMISKPAKLPMDVKAVRAANSVQTPSPAAPSSKKPR